MIAPTHDHPTLTDLQCEYLHALRDGKKLGKQVRGRLRRRGVRGSNSTFYRVMQRLKRRDLIKSEPAPRPKINYRGPEYFYLLTDAGHALVGPKLELHRGGGKKVRNKALRRELERVRACLG